MSNVYHAKLDRRNRLKLTQCDIGCATVVTVRSPERMTELSERRAVREETHP